jgi:hypothetical protein
LWCDARRWVPEAVRVLRPGGRAGGPVEVRWVACRRVAGVWVLGVMMAACC